MDGDELDGLTAGEKAYLESGGENAAGLLSENAAGGSSAPAAPVTAPEAKPDAVPVAKAAVDPVVKDAAKDPVAKPAKQVGAAATPGDDDDEGDAPPDGKIPYQKYQRDLRKQRERSKVLEKQLSEINEKFARGDERLRLLAEAMQPAPQQEVDQDPEPDPNVDLIAWANWSRRESGRIREALASTHQTVTETREDTAVRENYQRDAMSFAQQMPDFGGAYNHLLNTRAAMLAEQGHDEPSIRRILLNEEKGLVQRAFQAGKRPAAMIYNMAKQMGWNAPAAPQPAVQQGDGGAGAYGGNGNGHAPQANGAPAAGNSNGAKPSVVEEIERIQRGQAASKSLSDGGGTPQELSVEALASMSEQEFNALYAKSAGKIDAMLGKRSH